MVMIACIAGWFFKWRARHVFHEPNVAVHVIPFDLMRGGSGSPKEAFWKFKFCVHCLSYDLLVSE
jgi:hypothetical protein